MKIRNFLKKTLAVVLAFAMLAPIMGNLEVNLKEVKAEETSSDDSLHVKCQVTQGVVTDTNINKYRGNYVIRFVSAVKDYTAYSEIGFKVMEEGQTESEAKTAKVKTVFKRIESTTGSTATEQETYTFSPKVINTDAEYFITAKLPVAPANKAVKYTAWAYGIKKDGTLVEGQKRCLSVEDGQKDCETINMSFENTSSDDLTGLTLKANDTYDAKVIGVNDKTVHVRISDVPKPLKSATSFTFKNGDTKVGSGIFRNLYTEYDPDGDGTGTADDSWYTEYSAVGDTEFTIATSADLYGLASLVNASEDNVTFADKTIYVVSDIQVNKGTAKETGWVAATSEKTYPWTPIGTSSKPFSGTFDGCMHSISGISLSATSNNAGFFGYVKTDANATSPVTVKNLKLTNSYLTSANAYFGSVAGYANGGVFDSVKSDAIVVTSATRAGGFIGMGLGSIDMDDCWFAGKVTTTLSGNNIRTGGFMGTMYSGTLDMTNCLNTGAVSATSSEGYMKVSGFVGEASSSDTNTVTVNFTDCLNAGTVTKGSGNYGGFVGYTWTNATVNAYTSYNTDANAYASIIDYSSEDNTVSVYDDSNTAITVADMSIDSSAITGDAATSETGLAGFDFDNTWIVVTNGTPVLKSFEDEIINLDISWYSEEGGTAENPFVLYDKNDLYGFANLVNGGNNFAGKIIRLGDDIVINKGDAEDYAECVPQFGWTPIGESDILAFAGIFDGSDPETGVIHTISGVYSKGSVKNNGLFGVLSDGNIANLKLKNSYFYSDKQQLGSIVGYVAGGTLESVYSDAIVESAYNAIRARAGGLIGLSGNNKDSHEIYIKNCWFNGTLTNNGTATTEVAGFTGTVYAKTLEIENCLNTGLVKVPNTTATTACVGGMVGNVISGSGTFSVKNSIHNAPITCGTRANCIAGYNSSSTFVLDNVYYGGHSTVFQGGSASADEYRKISTDTDYTDLLNTGAWVTVEGTHPSLKSFTSGVIAPDTTWYDADSSSYTLYNAADLYGFSKLSQSNNFERKTVQLGADIVINEGDAEDWAEVEPYHEWQPIGSFAGTFNGQGHTISGVYLNTKESNSGLFKLIKSPADGTAVVQNLKLVNSYFETTGADCGSIAGRATGVINTVYSDAIVVSNSSRVGGFVGMGLTNVDMDKCWFAGQVVNKYSTSNSTGGFIGNMYAGVLTMDNCLNTGLVDVSANREFNSKNNTYYPKAGGFVGLHGYSDTCTANATITNCMNTGTKCVYDVVKTSYGAFTGYMNPTSSLTVNSSYVDSDKCDGRGYFAADYTTNPVDGYTEDIFKSYEEITGTNAETSLDGFDFTSTWTVAESGNVILTCFEEMEVLETSTNALHQTLIVNEELNVSEVTSVATLPKTSNWSDTMSYQGGCTTDGRYFYQALITYKDEADEEIDGTPKEADNLVKIFKYDKDTQQVVWSEELNLNHANDITYNSKLGYFVVCHNQGGANKVSYISIDTDEETGVESINLVETVELEENIYSIDYNSKYDQYIVGMSGGQEFTVLDSSFQQQYSFKPKAGTTPNFDTEEYVTQGICCDDKYIYCILENPDEIVVYDWFGRFVSEIRIENAQNYSAKLEPENISVLDDTIYFTAFSEGEFLNYQNSAVVYKFSATDLVEQ